MFFIVFGIHKNSGIFLGQTKETFINSVSIMDTFLLLPKTQN